MGSRNSIASITRNIKTSKNYRRNSMNSKASRNKRMRPKTIQIQKRPTRFYLDKEQKKKILTRKNTIHTSLSIRHNKDSISKRIALKTPMTKQDS